MMKTLKPVLAALFLCAAFQATAAPYPEHDVGRMVQPDHLDFSVADTLIEDLSRHAGEYPVKFDRPADLQRAQKEAAMLIKLLDKVLEQGIVQRKDPHYPAMLHRLARLSWMAHNMDMRGYAAVADRRYRELLAVSAPKKQAALQSEYGGFLASSGQTDDAVAMLEKALKNGYAPAGRPLALAYLAQGKTAQAKAELKRYVQKYPADTKAKMFLEAMEQGRVQVKQQPLKR